ncbi:hypothetical protein B0H14DRAFT_3700650 [Mycena olivaceomarginata]|nr:hypothetical protein B0H14DRAFT_3161187 [Mycena olivaceomarginata]KAJ7845748.1 hypothetical protein B0H14DRAFT_3139009 [Mycena olivaceomarginata]KAJ7890984.1 hypothetical protein B0H14DRAFT_3700650 [Mycena olivaceomarginata]
MVGRVIPITRGVNLNFSSQAISSFTENELTRRDEKNSATSVTFLWNRSSCAPSLGDVLRDFKYAHGAVPTQISKYRSSWGARGAGSILIDPSVAAIECRKSIAHVDRGASYFYTCTTVNLTYLVQSLLKRGTSCNLPEYDSTGAPLIAMLGEEATKRTSYLTNHLREPHLSGDALHRAGPQDDTSGTCMHAFVATGDFTASASSPSPPPPDIVADCAYTLRLAPPMCLGLRVRTPSAHTISPRTCRVTVAAFASDLQTRTACPYSLTSTEHLALAIRPAAPVEHRNRPRSPGRPTVRLPIQQGTSPEPPKRLSARD